MSLLRSDRFPAVVLLLSAILGLIVANSAASDVAFDIKDFHFGIPGVLDLSVGHWIADGILVIFFFVVAVELQYELTKGQLASARKAIQPAIAAAGGVIVPVVIYFAFAFGTESATGWPIPTATDIAFALGVLAIFGRGLPSGLRIFLLALAILDDIVGIVFIAVLYTSDVDFALLGLSVVTIAVFGYLSRKLDSKGRGFIIAALIVLAVLAWAFVYLSGVHATIAGVGLGLVMAQQPALRARHEMEPWVNGIVLPLFAFSSALVVIPSVPLSDLQPAFWGVFVALPLGKIVGITVFGWISQRVIKGSGERLPLVDLMAAGALGGIGFTVSLLLSELAFANNAELRDEATLGVLAGSIVSLLLAAVIVSLRARGYRRALVDTAVDAAKS